MKQLNNKGQVMQNLGALAVGIVALVIILAVTFLLMSNVRTQAIDQTPNTAITDEKVDNATASTLTNACTSIACTAAHNGTTTGAVIPATNYSCSVSGSVATYTPAMGAYDGGNNGTVFIDYTCTRPSNAYNSTVDLTNATATIPGWVPLIILVIIGSIILGLVSAFKRK